MNEEEELKKGCGKPLEELRCGEKWDSVFIYCGDVIGTKREYCPTCQAKLLQRQEDVKEFEKKFDKLVDRFRNLTLNNNVISKNYIELGYFNKMVDELKEQLQKEIGGDEIE